MKSAIHVTCNDGKVRTFKGDASELRHWKGSKYTYIIDSEIGGRGFITLKIIKGRRDLTYVLAENKLQPLRIRSEEGWEWSSSSKLAYQL